MKPNEQPRKTFFDMVIENSKLKAGAGEEKKPAQSNRPTRGLIFWIGWLAGFFLFGLVLHLSVSVIAQKTTMPAFSYIEVLKLYAGALVIKRIFK